MQKFTFEEFSEVIYAALNGNFNDLKICIEDNSSKDEDDSTKLSISVDQWPAPYVLNLDELYHDYMSGDYIENIVEKTKGILRNIETACSSLDTQSLYDYDKAKNALYVELRPIKGNEQLISISPHRIIGDMVLLCGVVALSTSGDNNATIGATINNERLEGYGITEKQLYTDAMKSSQIRFPAYLRRLDESIYVPDGFNHPPIYEVGIDNSENGAAAIAYPDFMESVSVKLGGSLYVFPMSIHGALIIKDDGKVDEEYLKTLEWAFYNSDENPYRTLSDKIYYYDSETHELGLARFETEDDA